MFQTIIRRRYIILKTVNTFKGGVGTALYPVLEMRGGGRGVNLMITYLGGSETS